MTREEFHNIKPGDTLYRSNTAFGTTLICESIVEVVLKDDYGFHKVFARTPNGKLEELPNTRFTRKSWYTTEIGALRRLIHVSKGLRSFYIEELLLGKTPEKAAKERIDFYEKYIYNLEKKLKETRND